MRNSEARTVGMRSGSRKLETIAHQQAGEHILHEQVVEKLQKIFVN